MFPREISDNWHAASAVASNTHQNSVASSSLNQNPPSSMNGHTVTAKKAVGPSNQKTGRRSWFDTPPTTKLDIPLEVEKVDPKKSEEIEILMLSHFTSTPRIDFGKVKTGKRKTRTLLIRNPHDYEQGVTIEKFPDKKKFSVQEKKFIVPPKTTLPLVIEWSPDEACCCREMILFIIDNVYRLQAFVFGTAEAPPKKKKITGKRGLLSSKVKKPLTIVQTPSLTSIKNAYTPSKAGDTSLVENYFYDKKIHTEMSENSENINPSQQDVQQSPKMTGSPPLTDQQENVVVVNQKILKESGNTSHDKDSSKTPTTNNDVIENFKNSSHKVLCHAGSRDSSTKSSNDIIESPVSFVSETREFQYKVKTSKEILQSTAISSPSPQSCSLNESQKITATEFPKTFLSPDTFLSELNASQNLSHNVLRVSGELPSPSDVLNDSVPHNIMVKQLQSVRYSILDALSDPENTSSSSSVKKRVFTRKHHMPSIGHMSGAERMDAKTDMVENLKCGIAGTKFSSKLENKILPQQQRELPHRKNILNKHVTTQKLKTNSPKKMAHGVLRKRSAVIISKHSPRNKNTMSARSKKAIPDQSSTSGLRNSADEKKRARSDNDLVDKQLRSLTVTKTKLPSTPTTACNVKKPLFQVTVDDGDTEIVPSGTTPLGLHGQAHHNNDYICTPDLSTDVALKKQIDSIFKFEITATPLTETELSKENIQKSNVSAANSPFTKLCVPNDVTGKSPNGSDTSISNVNITPHQIPLSPKPDTSRRSTHLVDKRCSYLHKTMGQRRLFSPVPGHEYDPEDIFPGDIQHTSGPSTNTSLKELESTVTENELVDGKQLDISPTEDVNSHRLSKEQPDLKKNNVHLSESDEKIVSIDGQKSQNKHSSSKVTSELVSKTKTSHTNFTNKTVKRSVRRSVVSTEVQEDRIKIETRKRLSGDIDIPKVQRNPKRIKSDSSAVTAVRTLKRRAVSDSVCASVRVTTAIKTIPKKVVKVKKPAKGVPQAKLLLVKKMKTALPKHPLPFAARNMYYDERWMDKQEGGFVQWLNFVLTPPEEYNQSIKKVKVDANKLCIDGKASLKLAPTKEVLSFRAYAARQRLNRLRRSACRLLQSEDVIKVIIRLEAEVESKRLAVRKDRMLHADLGIKQKVLDLILSYNPLWLRIGLETIYGEIIPLQNNNDVFGLSRFIITRLLGNPDIAQEYSHPTVPHLYRDGYGEALAGHTLKKYILLVFFLDKAKQKRLIDHDPCLFCKDSDVKSSKDLLVFFSRDYLSGEGDVTRHLAYFNLTVKHVQTALDEFDYAVTNLATDLRDGLRLTRVIELLTENWTLTKRLRAPAISRLQKVHNIEVVLKCLEERGLKFENGKVNPRSIVDGHREKTLTLLWYMIFNFQVNILINEEILKEEIAHLEKSLKAKAQLDALCKQYDGSFKGDTNDRRESGEADVFSDNKLVVLLMKWCRVVCSHYNIQVENFTVSFSDGRALCYLIHHYHPALLPRSSIQNNTTQTYQQQLADLNSTGNDSLLESEDDSSPFKALESPGNFEELMSNEKENFKLVHDKISEIGGIPLMLKSTDMCNTIPDEKVVMTYLTYLCARLLVIRHESRAARIIQNAWRRRRLKKYQENYEVNSKAAITIQRAFRKFTNAKRSLKMNKAALTIQAYWRGYRTRRMLRDIKNREQLSRMEQAVRVIQEWFRGVLTQRKFQQMKQSVIKIQAYFRGHSIRKKYIQQCKAALHIQMWFRSLKQKKKCQSQYTLLKRSAVTVQSYFRGFKARQFFRRLKAVIFLQSYWKMCLERNAYKQLKCATLVLQKYSRRNKMRKAFMSYKSSALTIQQSLRSRKQTKVLRSQFLMKRIACLTIQQNWRQYQNRKQLKKHVAAIKIQSCWRKFSNRKTFCTFKASAVVIQKNVRMFIERDKYSALKKSVATIEGKFQAYKLMKQQQKQYLEMKKAAVVLQKHYRGCRVRFHLLRQYAAALIIQTRVRMYLSRKAFLNMKLAAVKIQTAYRSYKMMKQIQTELTSKKLACLTIQTAWRKYLCEKASRQALAARRIQTNWRCYCKRKSYLRCRHAVITLQKNIRMVLTRKRFLKMKAATITIQRMVKAVALKKAEQCHVTAMKNAAITLQKYFRGYRERRNFLQTKAAVLVIQSLYRRNKTRREYLLLRNNIILIQQHHRHRQNCRKIQNQYKTQKAACVLIQRKWRQLINQKQNNSAALIQAAWKSYYARKKFLTFKRASLYIQKYFRAYLKRRHLLRQKYAVVTLQRHFRAHLQCQHARENYLCLKKAAMLIQTKWRCYIARKEFLNKRNASKVIQKHVRCWMKFTSFRRLRYAVNIVKNKYRSNQVRKEYLRKRRAIIVLQSCCRAFILHKQYSKMKLCSVRIQSAWRKYLARKQFLKMRSAAVCIQNWIRIRLQLNHKRRDSIVKRACIIIQSKYRMYSARKKYLELRKAAIKIQSMFRKHITKKHFQNVKVAVLKMQSLVRANIACRSKYREYRLVKSAAITLQKHVRGYHTRKMIDNQHQAALCIQRSYRQYLCNLQRLKQKYAAIVIQNVFRRIALRKKASEWKELVFHHTHVTLCWKVFSDPFQTGNSLVEMGKIKQKSFSKPGISKNSSVDINLLTDEVKSSSRRQNGLTSNLMSHNICPSKRMEVYHMQKAAVKSQEKCVVEKLSLKEQFKYNKMRAAVIYIQMWFRKYLCRKREKRHRAAVLIQSTFRMHLTRKDYLLKLISITHVQAFMRTCIAVRKYKEKVCAIKTIQEFYRTYSLAKAIQTRASERTKAVCIIQAHYRGYKARHLYRQIKAVKKLQLSIRQYLHRRRIRKLVYVVVTLQAHVRGLLARKRYKELYRQHSAAACIQKFYRKYAEKKNSAKRDEERRICLEHLANKHIDKVIIIQRYFRAYIQRKRHCRLRRAVVLVQQHFRKKLANREKAAKKIQRCFREWMIRQKTKRLAHLAVVIQAAWRGYVVRRNSKSKRLSAIRRRISAVNRSATDENTLGYRTRSALDYLLKHKQLSYILEALVHLDVATRLSPKCCESMVKVNAVQVIYKLIRSCNRSLPHMELIKYSVNILLNLTKYEKTASAVYEVEDSIVTLLDLMQIYREKGAIFTKTCTLLGILGTDDKRREGICSDKRVVERLQSFYSLTLRKHKIDERNKIKKARLAASQSFNSSLYFTPAKRQIKIRPEWAMRRDSIHELEDPMIAINFVINNLHLSPK